jgi:hypothetical protein
MMPLARLWFNFIADYHNERALDHARRRDRALRKLERLERRRLRRQVARDIDRILADSSRPEVRALREAFRRHYTGPQAPLRKPAPVIVELAADDTK